MCVKYFKYTKIFIYQSEFSIFNKLSTSRNDRVNYKENDRVNLLFNVEKILKVL